MSTFELRCYAARYNAAATQQVGILIAQQGPLARQLFQATTATECETELRSYREEAEATGQCCVVTVTCIKGRKPKGFSKLPPFLSANAKPEYEQ